MLGLRSRIRRAVLAPLMLGAALAVFGALSPTAKGQWWGVPGWGPPGFGVGPGFGYGYGFGFGGWGGGFGFGVPPTAIGYGYGMYPGAFSVLNQPDVQAGLAYNALATGRLSPYSYNANPYAMSPWSGFGGSYIPGFGPFGYAGAAYYNPYFLSGLTPLALESAIAEQVLSRASSPTVRVRVIPDPAEGPARPVD